MSAVTAVQMSVCSSTAVVVEMVGELLVVADLILSDDDGRRLA